MPDSKLPYAAKYDLLLSYLDVTMKKGDFMQISRLFEIVYILLDKKTVTAGELAERFEVSQRTIYRDVETLSSSGIPIYMSKGKGGGISLLPGFILNKAVLSEKEKADILLALKASSSVGISESDTALKKLSGLFGSVSTDWLEVDFSSWSNTPKEGETFEKLKKAVTQRNVISFMYSNAKGENITREAEPVKLCYKSGSWYVFAFCRLRKDFRFFKLSRMKELSVSDETFMREAPSAIIPKKEWTGESVTLKLRLAPEASFRVYEEFETMEKQSDGSFIVELKIPKQDWIYGYIFTFGEHCEVLEPEDFRAEVKNRLEKSLKQYL